MNLENRCLVSASSEETWNLLMDIPRAASCVPGFQDIAPEGENAYRATVRVRVGPMGLNLSGVIKLLEHNQEEGAARFQVEAADRRVGGSVRSEMVMQLHPQSDNQTELVINSDTTFMGRLAELGQPIIRRKASSTIAEFAANLANELNKPST